MQIYPLGRGEHRPHSHEHTCGACSDVGMPPHTLGWQQLPLFGQWTLSLPKPSLACFPPCSQPCYVPARFAAKQEQVTTTLGLPQCQLVPGVLRARPVAAGEPTFCHPQWSQSPAPPPPVRGAVPQFTEPSVLKAPSAHSSQKALTSAGHTQVPPSCHCQDQDSQPTLGPAQAGLSCVAVSQPPGLLRLDTTVAHCLPPSKGSKAH